MSADSWHQESPLVFRFHIPRSDIATTASPTGTPYLLSSLHAFKATSTTSMDSSNPLPQNNFNGIPCALKAMSLMPIRLWTRQVLWNEKGEKYKPH